MAEAPGSKEGAEEGTGDERKGAEDAGRPTGDCGRKKAAASENGRAGAEIDDPADETATGGCPATTGGISEASGEPARLASGANNDGEPTEAGEGGFWPEPASPGKRVNEFIVLSAQVKQQQLYFTQHSRSGFWEAQQAREKSAPAGSRGKHPRRRSAAVRGRHDLRKILEKWLFTRV